MADALNFVRDASNVVRESANHKKQYESVLGCKEAVCNLLSLCLTRWCVRSPAISRVCYAYGEILATLLALEDDKKMRNDTWAKIAGLLKQVKNAKTYFGLLCCEAIFGPCEGVAKSLQGVGASALGALECIQFVGKRIEVLRQEDSVVDLFNKTQRTAAQYNLKIPQPKRLSKTQGCNRQTTELEGISLETTEVAWKREFYEALDLVAVELQ